MRSATPPESEGDARAKEHQSLLVPTEADDSLAQSRAQIVGVWRWRCTNHVEGSTKPPAAPRRSHPRWTTLASLADLAGIDPRFLTSDEQAFPDLESNLMLAGGPAYPGPAQTELQEAGLFRAQAGAGLTYQSTTTCLMHYSSMSTKHRPSSPTAGDIQAVYLPYEMTFRNPCFRRERAMIGLAACRSTWLPPSVRCSCHSSQAMVRENAGQDMGDMCPPPFERFLALGHELVPLVHCGYTGDRS
jgi:hypothetical protein